MKIKANLTLKLTGFLLLISVMPLLFFEASSYRIARNTIVQMAGSYSMRLLSNQRDYLNLQMDQVENLASNIGSVEEINRVLATADDFSNSSHAYDSLSTQARIGYILSGYSNLKGLVSIDLFTRHGMHFHVGDTLNVADQKDALRDRLYRKALSLDQSVVWHGVEDNINTASSHKKVVVATKIIKRANPVKLELEPVGMLLVNYSTDYLYEHLSKIHLGEGSTLLVVDAERRMLYHPQKNLIGDPLLPEFSSLISGESGAKPLMLDGQSVLLSYIYMPDKGWYVIGITPQKTLTAPMEKVAQTGWWVLMVCLALIAFSIRLFNHQVIAPIKRVSDAFRSLQSNPQDAQARLPVPHAVNEISELVRWFNDFLDTLAARRRAENELREAKELAVRANQAKGEFLANMSHEIRTPMNAIIGLTQLALESRNREDVHEYLSKTNRSAESLLGIINDILDFSKIEAGKLTIEQIEFRLDEVIGSINDLLGAAIQEKGLELIVRVAPDIPLRLIGDPLRLRQILQNLISNAIKFTERGEIDVSVRMQEASANALVCRFEVRDTGIGITEEQIGRLFQSFSQADMSTTRKHGGTGLGLAICRQLACLMGGDMGIDSVYGQGSTLWFTVRFGAAVCQAETLPVQLAVTPEILFIDDNQTACNHYLVLCHTQGWQARATTLVDDWQALLQTVPANLLMIDYRLPKGNGIELAQQIMQALPAMDAKIVLMATQDDIVAVQSKAWEIGVRLFLEKPVTLYPLIGVVQSAFNLSDVPMPARTVHAGALLAGIDPSLQGLQVLLVEDHPINQVVARKMLERTGVVVTIANHGADALQILANHRFDAILMDCQMPVMDGYETTRRIRQDAALCHLPVIAMTANALTGEQERCMAAGMNAYITKPVDTHLLYRTLAALVKQTGSPEQQEASSLPAVPVSEPDGIDQAGALAAMEGDRGLYLKLMRMFIEIEQDFLARFSAALSAGDLVTAKRSAHSLKGISATLGAHALSRHAAALESAVKSENRHEIESEHQAIQPVFSATLAEIKTIVDLGPHEAQ